MSIIGDSIKFLREQKGWSQNDLAQKLGTYSSKIGSYEEGRAKPKFELMNKLAELFHVNAKDLIKENFGEEESDNNKNSVEQTEIEHQGLQLKKKLKEKRVNLAYLAKSLGRDRTSVYNLFKKENISIEKLIALEKLTGIDLSEIYQKKLDKHQMEKQAYDNTIGAIKKELNILQKDMIDLLQRINALIGKFEIVEKENQNKARMLKNLS